MHGGSRWRIDLVPTLVAPARGATGALGISSLTHWDISVDAALTYSPNSCPPERVFSILNDTFDDDQESAKADYMEYSLMRQFNQRGRAK